MGYTTDFYGSVSVTPPLNQAEIDYLNLFASTRRMHRKEGPYYAVDDGDLGQRETSGVINFNEPAQGQPGLWCQWVPTEDGTAIEWDGGEKFYDAEVWMQYLIDHFLRPAARAKGQPGFEDFTFDHVVSGTIEAQGEDPGDQWQLVVTNNAVTTKVGTAVYS